jgi:hypothetical protein
MLGVLAIGFHDRARHQFAESLVTRLARRATWHGHPVPGG